MKTIRNTSGRHMGGEVGFKKPLARQIREGVDIEMSESTLMNSKSEWNHSRIPRIVIEDGDKQSEDIESGLGKKYEGEKRVWKRTRNPKRRVIDEMGFNKGSESHAPSREKRQKIDTNLEGTHLERFVLRRKGKEEELHRKDVRERK